MFGHTLSLGSVTKGDPMPEEQQGDFIEDSLALAPEPYKTIIRRRLGEGLFAAPLNEMQERYGLTEDQIDTVTLMTLRAACDPDLIDSLKDGLIAEADVSYEIAVKLQRDIIRDVVLPIKNEGDAAAKTQAVVKTVVRPVDFPELYRKFLEIYWQGDIDNALRLDDRAREAHQNDVESDIDRLETIYSFATERSMELSGRVDHIYNHEDGCTVYLEKVFIVDEGSNVLRFEFGGRISYPQGVTVPCKPGDTYSFNGRIGSAEFSWSYMNPRHIYASFGFKHDVTFLCLDISLDDATCVSADESYYDGRRFGLTRGERFRPKRQPPNNSGGPTADTARGGCFIATAAYGVDYNDELSVLYELRDQVLRRSRLGRRCVSLYYVASPPIASWIARRDWSRALLRRYVLNPIVFFGRRFLSVT
jgi:hypothetical protein